MIKVENAALHLSRTAPDYGDDEIPEGNFSSDSNCSEKLDVDDTGKEVTFFLFLKGLILHLITDLLDFVTLLMTNIVWWSVSVSNMPEICCIHTYFCN